MNVMAKYQQLRTLKTSVSGKLLYLLLLEISDAGGTAVVSQKRICNAIGLARSTVNRNLRCLCKEGYLHVVARYHSDGGRAANQYILR